MAIYVSETESKIIVCFEIMIVSKQNDVCIKWESRLLKLLSRKNLFRS